MTDNDLREIQAELKYMNILDVGSLVASSQIVTFYYKAF